MSKPLLALIARGDVPAPLHRLFVELTPDAQPAMFEPQYAALYGAAIVASPTLVSEAPKNMPLAVWVDTVDELESLRIDEVVAILASSDDVLAASGPKAVCVAAEVRTQPGTRVMAPNVRRRLREARRLPARAVVDLDDDRARWCGQPIARSSVDTALACAAVAAVRGRSILRAMAWGAPVVTDEATRASVRAVADRDVAVAEEASTASADVLDDERLASRLSWCARRFYETHYDLRDAVSTLVRRFGLYRLTARPAARVDGVLAEMWTPADAPVLDRVHELLLPVVDPT